MKCIAPERFTALLEQGGLDAATGDEAAHLESCADCRQAWSEAAAADGFLRKVAAARRPAHARRTRAWGMLTLAASLMLCALIVLTIFSAPHLRRDTPAAPQDDAGRISELLEKLDSDEIARRDEAAAELLQTPFDKLPLLEEALDSGKPEVRARVEGIVADILTRSLTRPADGFQIRLQAPSDVARKWRDAGADPADPPEGYEACAGKPESDDPGAGEAPSAKVLLQKGNLLTSKHFVPDGLTATRSAPTGATFKVRVMVKVTDEGRQRMLKWKEEEKARRGPANTVGGGRTVVVLVDGRMIVRATLTPAISDENVIGPIAHSKEDAGRLVQVLVGKWTDLRFRLPGGEEAAARVRKSPGFAGSLVRKAGDGAWSVLAPESVRPRDLVALWRSLRKAGFPISPGKK